jgi:biopolymer transport protein ExbD
MRFSKSKHAGEQDFELNLASIIDCFTVLITYLLVSASFISLGVLDVNVLTQRPDGDTTSEPPMSLSLRIDGNHEVAMRLEGGGHNEQTIRVPAKDGALDAPGLEQRLADLKREMPELDTATVRAGGGVEYFELVSVVESTKKLIPAVSLGERTE